MYFFTSTYGSYIQIRKIETEKGKKKSQKEKKGLQVTCRKDGFRSPDLDAAASVAVSSSFFSSFSFFSFCRCLFFCEESWRRQQKTQQKNRIEPLYKNVNSGQNRGKKKKKGNVTTFYPCMYITYTRIPCNAHPNIQTRRRIRRRRRGRKSL